MNEQEQAVFRIREFTRFYLPRLGLLGNHYLDSEYSPTEARVLYEVYENNGCNAAHIARVMNIDKSYLSRIIRAHERKGYLTRTVSETDSRSFHIHLTEAGMAITRSFNQKSDEQIRKIIGSLKAEDYETLISALNTVTDILKKCSGNPTKKEE